MGVEFNEHNNLISNYPEKKTGISNMIIKTGLAKDQAGANKVMLTIAVICFLLSIYFFLKI